MVPGSDENAVSSIELPHSRYDDLVNAATELFSRLGYERTTVRMIADQLGIQSGSLYSHISSKEEVLKKVVMFVGADFISRAERNRECGVTPTGTLREMCRSHLDVIDERLSAVTVYFNEWQKLEVNAQKEIIRLRERYEKNFADVVAWGIETGEFTTPDPRPVVLVLLSALNWTYRWYRPGGRQSPHQIADGLLDVVLNGLVKEQAALVPGPKSRRKGA